MSDTGVGGFLLRNARQLPNRLAVVTEHGQLTWGGLDTAACRVTRGLRRAGVGRGDRVAVLARNCLQSVVLWWATQKVGATYLPLNIRLLPDELAQNLALADCRYVAFAEPLRATAQAVARIRGPGTTWIALSPHGGVVAGLPALTFDDPATDCPNGLDGPARHGNDDCGEQVLVDSDDESLLLFTSGTSGYRKGVLRTQAMVRDHAMVLGLHNQGVGEQEVMLTASPLFHTGGMLALLKMAALGGTVILLNHADPNLVVDYAERYAATQIMLLPPVVYDRLATAPDLDRRDLTRVHTVLVSAGRFPPSTADLLLRVFPRARLRVSWGSTETCSATGMDIDRDDLAADPGLLTAVGWANALVEVRLVGQDGAAVPIGCPGEALVRSPMVCSGYLNGGEQSEGAFAPDGWFRTRDVLRQDELRRFYFIDRAADMVKTGGENVYASEIERVLEAHPAVRCAAVVPVPDQEFGEAVAAALVLQPGAVLHTEALMKFCRERLPSYKKPRYLAVLANLPTNAVGKVDKPALRARPQAFRRVEATRLP
jgi:acyl-CoA synthetase (AMP-forming)/AMP-acid ligase II